MSAVMDIAMALSLRDKVSGTLYGTASECKSIERIIGEIKKGFNDFELSAARWRTSKRGGIELNEPDAFPAHSDWVEDRGDAVSPLKDGVHGSKVYGKYSISDIVKASAAQADAASGVINDITVPAAYESYIKQSKPEINKMTDTQARAIILAGKKGRTEGAVFFDLKKAIKPDISSIERLPGLNEGSNEWAGVDADILNTVNTGDVAGLKKTATRIFPGTDNKTVAGADGSIAARTVDGIRKNVNRKALEWVTGCLQGNTGFVNETIPSGLTDAVEKNNSRTMGEVFSATETLGQISSLFSRNTKELPAKEIPWVLPSIRQLDVQGLETVVKSVMPSVLKAGTADTPVSGKGNAAWAGFDADILNSVDTGNITGLIMVVSEVFPGSGNKIVSGADSSIASRMVNGTSRKTFEWETGFTQGNPRFITEAVPSVLADAAEKIKSRATGKVIAALEALGPVYNLFGRDDTELLAGGTLRGLPFIRQLDARGLKTAAELFKPQVSSAGAAATPISDERGVAWAGLDNNILSAMNTADITTLKKAVSGVFHGTDNRTIAEVLPGTDNKIVTEVFPGIDSKIIAEVFPGADNRVISEADSGIASIMVDGIKEKVNRNAPEHGTGFTRVNADFITETITSALADTIKNINHEATDVVFLASEKLGPVSGFFGRDTSELLTREIPGELPFMRQLDAQGLKTAAEPVTLPVAKAGEAEAGENMRMFFNLHGDHKQYKSALTGLIDYGSTDITALIRSEDLSDLYYYDMAESIDLLHNTLIPDIEDTGINPGAIISGIKKPEGIYADMAGDKFAEGGIKKPGSAYVKLAEGKFKEGGIKKTGGVYTEFTGGEFTGRYGRAYEPDRYPDKNSNELTSQYVEELIEKIIKKLDKKSTPKGRSAKSSLVMSPGGVRGGY